MKTAPAVSPFPLAAHVCAGEAARGGSEVEAARAGSDIFNPGAPIERTPCTVDVKGLQG